MDASRRWRGCAGSCPARALTLTGPGGCGKTRLTIEYARQQQPRFRDGVTVVELATVREPELVADAVARAIGIPPEGDAELSTLVRRLRDKHLLLVVDNCEHLVAEVARTIAWLLRECAEMSVLATSREPLNVDGETVWRVPPLSLPEPADSPHTMLTADAVRFFIDRARAARPEYVIDGSNVATVAAICHRLDGMPLSIELAAARVGVVSPAAIPADQALPSLDLMENTIGTSRDLASEATRRRSLTCLGRILGARTLSALRTAGDAWVKAAPYVAGVYGIGFFLPIGRNSPR